MTWAESESKEAATVVEEDGEDKDEDDACYERVKIVLHALRCVNPLSGEGQNSQRHVEEEQFHVS